VFVSRLGRGSGIGLRGVLRMAVWLVRVRWELGRGGGENGRDGDVLQVIG
jgi:hypothetical protein